MSSVTALAFDYISYMIGSDLFFLLGIAACGSEGEKGSSQGELTVSLSWRTPGNRLMVLPMTETRWSPGFIGSLARLMKNAPTTAGCA